MAHKSKHSPRRSGFTLPEVLVAVAMVGVLSAVILPSVTGQIAKSEASRVVQDLQNISQGIQTYRTDMGAWPSTVEDLIAISPTDTKWHGPYINSANDGTNGFSTGGGAVIENALTSAAGVCGTPTFMIISFSTDPSADLADRVDLQLDADVNGANGSAGLFRYTGGAGTSAKYCAVPITK